MRQISKLRSTVTPGRVFRHATIGTRLLRGRLGEHIHDDHTGDDEGHPEDGGEVGFLTVKHPCRQCNQDDAETGPNGVGDADGDLPKGLG